MQTIARANRVFPGKHSGVIVDYANIFGSLEKALAIYGAGKGGDMPVRDKQAIAEALRKGIEDVFNFCAGLTGGSRSGTPLEKPPGRQHGTACKRSMMPSTF